MDYISSPNIFSLSCCDLNTKFNARCHSDWSETNLISMVTKDGIYILQLHLERGDEPFEIDLIRNLGNKFRHAPFEKANISAENNWASFDNRQYMGTFLDPALLTNVVKRNSDSYPRRFRSAKWSPALELYPKQCLLTVLTVDFQLLIYHLKHAVWTVLANLSQIYDDLWMQTSVLSSRLADTSFDAMRMNIHSLSFNSVCWIDDSLLLSSTLTGDLVVWRVSLLSSDINSNKTRPFLRNRINFSVIYIIRTNQEYISSMQLYKNLLIVSTRNGQVTLYDLSTVLVEIRANGNSKELKRPVTTKKVPKKQQEDESVLCEMLAIIDMPPTAILWHQDNIEVMDFYLDTLTEDTFRIVLTKSTNICWCTIHYKERTATELATLAISDSFSAINGLDPEVSLHQTPATWLRPAGNSRAVLIADDGSFFQLDFLDNRHDTSPSFNAIRTGKLDLTDMVPRGLCTSPNGMLITMISSATFLVDSFKVPAPTKIIVLPTINERRFFIDCMQNLLDEEWLISQGVKSPMNVCDRIDCIRSMIPQLNHYQFDRLQLMLKEEIAHLGYPKTDTQLVILKILNFILLKLEGLDCYSELPDDGLGISLEQNIYDVILMANIDRVMSFVFTSTSPDDSTGRTTTLESLDECQIRSLRNYISWLGKSLCGQHIRDKYVNKCSEFMAKYKKVPHETCSICQGAVPFVTQKHGVCQNQHQYVRCSSSLLLLDTSKNEVIQCADCKRSYLSELIWPSTNGMWLCMYCH